MQTYVLYIIICGKKAGFYFSQIIKRTGADSGKAKIWKDIQSGLARIICLWKVLRTGGELMTNGGA